MNKKHYFKNYFERGFRVYLATVFKNNFLFFKIKNLKNMFDNKKTIFCFLILRTQNMVFSNNIF